jgi:hypothetical protein
MAEIDFEDFYEQMKDYRFVTFMKKGTIDGSGLQGIPYPAWAPQMITWIKDPVGRCDAWLDLANFCNNSGDWANKARFADEAESVLPEIEKRSVRDTRTLLLIRFVWLDAGDRAKALDKCQQMEPTVKKAKALLEIVDFDARRGDDSQSQPLVLEAEELLLAGKGKSKKAPTQQTAMVTSVTAGMEALPGPDSIDPDLLRQALEGSGSIIDLIPPPPN